MASRVGSGTCASTSRGTDLSGRRGRAPAVAARPVALARRDLAGIRSRADRARQGCAGTRLQPPLATSAEARALLRAVGSPLTRDRRSQRVRGRVEIGGAAERAARRQGVTGCLSPSPSVTLAAKRPGSLLATARRAQFRAMPRSGVSEASARAGSRPLLVVSQPFSPAAKPSRRLGQRRAASWLRRSGPTPLARPPRASPLQTRQGLGPPGRVGASKV